MLTAVLMLKGGSRASGGRGLSQGPGRSSQVGGCLDQTTVLCSLDAGRGLLSNILVPVSPSPFVCLSVHRAEGTRFSPCEGIRPSPGPGSPQASHNPQDQDQTLGAKS